MPHLQKKKFEYTLFPLWISGYPVNYTEIVQYTVIALKRDVFIADIITG